MSKDTFLILYLSFWFVFYAIGGICFVVIGLLRLFCGERWGWRK